MPLTSPRNPLIQKVRGAVESGRRLDNGLIAAEGPHLLAEALDSRWQVDHVFWAGEAMDRHQAILNGARLQNAEITEVAERVFKSISDTEHSQNILALLRPPDFSFAELLVSAGPLVILDGIQDPGNAGAIIRSAEAFGGCGIALSNGCVRISNGKLLRAAAGSVFRLPFMEQVETEEAIERLRAAGRPIFSLAAKGSASLSASRLGMPFALVVGSEGRGVSREFLNGGKTLSIPTQGVESLNAAIACSIALFEAARQRGECA